MENTNLKNTVERVEIIAYLKDGETLISIDAIILNGWKLDGLDLKGYKRSDFSSLQDDIACGLEFVGMSNIDYSIL